MATNSEAGVGAGEEGAGEDAPTITTDGADPESVEAEKRVRNRGRIGRWPANDYY
jgi:hypothetical protein